MTLLRIGCVLSVLLAAVPAAALDWRKPGREEVIASLQRAAHLDRAGIVALLDEIGPLHPDFAALIGEVEKARGKRYEPSAIFGTCTRARQRDETFRPSAQQLACQRADVDFSAAINRSADGLVETVVMRLPFTLGEPEVAMEPRTVAIAPAIDLQAKNLAAPPNVLFTRDGDRLLILVDLR